MSIKYLHHATSIEHIEEILKRGLRSSSASDDTRSEDDLTQMIFFDYIGSDDQRIFYTRTGSYTARSTDIVLVLDYHRLYLDFQKSVPPLDEADIFIYPDLRRFDATLRPVWSQRREFPNQQPVPIQNELVISFETEYHPIYLPIIPYLVAIHTTSTHVSHIKKLLQKYHSKSKIYLKVDRRHATEIKRLCTNEHVDKKELLKYIREYHLPQRGTKVDLCVRLYQLALMTWIREDQDPK